MHKLRTVDMPKSIQKPDGFLHNSYVRTQSIYSVSY